MTGIRPTSSSGAWAVSLAATFIVIFVLSPYTVPYVGTNRGIIGMASGSEFGLVGTAALVVGLISVIRNKERSVFVFLSLIVGLYALGFLLGSLLWVISMLQPSPSRTAAISSLVFSSHPS